MNAQHVAAVENTAAHSGGAVIVRVKRRPGQSFVTLSSEFAERQATRFRRLGWEVEVEPFLLVEPLEDHRIRLAARDLLAAAMHGETAIEEVISDIETFAAPDAEARKDIPEWRRVLAAVRAAIAKAQGRSS